MPAARSRGDTDATGVASADRVDMYARAVEDAGIRLRELRAEERDDLAVGALGLALSLAATQVYPALAIPCFLAGVIVGARGVRALLRHWELVDRLTCDRDAYVIPEVFDRAAREATLERRKTFAAVLRTWLGCPWPDLEPRVKRARLEIEKLIGELDDERLALDVESAVRCNRLLSEGTGSPLLDVRVPPEDLEAWIRHIRSGFTPVDAEGADR